MSIVVGFDPGPKGKGGGVAVMTPERLVACGQHEAHDPVLHSYIQYADAIVIEMISCYGMAVGMSTFQTLIEAGRVVEIALHYNVPIYLMPRKDIKLVMCGTSQAKDKNVRASIIDRFPATGGGSKPQIGVKANPGPLFGVAAHAWPAIAAALSYSCAMPERGMDIEKFRYTNEQWMEFK